MTPDSANSLATSPMRRMFSSRSWALQMATQAKECVICAGWAGAQRAAGKHAGRGAHAPAHIHAGGQAGDIHSLRKGGWEHAAAEAACWP